MSAQSNIEAVTRIYAAMAAGNPASAMAYFDQNVVLVEPESLPYGGTHRGLAELGAAIAEIMKYVDLAGLKLERIIADQATAIAALTAGQDNCRRPTLRLGTHRVDRTPATLPS